MDGWINYYETIESWAITMHTLQYTSIAQLKIYQFQWNHHILLITSYSQMKHQDFDGGSPVSNLKK